MRYLLDTDVVSDLMRREPSSTLIRRMAAVPAEDQCTSSITLGELLYGAHRHAERTDELIRRIAAVIPADLPVLGFDEAAARSYGRLRAALERSGTPIGEADMRIAAIALSHSLVVVTGNVRHFARVPDLVVEDWLAR